jgi:histidinol-phosphate aminotransferase
VVMGAPAFVVYKLVTLLFGAKAIEVPLVNWRHDLGKIAAAITPRTKLVYVCTPNNPTGTTNTEAELIAFVRGLPDHVVVVVDEAYAEFVERAPDLRPLIAEGRKLVCLRTFSKIYGLASLRVGYALAALDDAEFAEKTARENRAGLAQIERGCAALGLEFVPSVANFMLIKVGDGLRVFDALQRRGVIVRPVKSYGLPEWIRITVGTHEQNVRLLAELATAVAA